MTLPERVVDCENCVQPGQLGVAVGRAVSTGQFIFNPKFYT
jgi:hypothetical protein